MTVAEPGATPVKRTEQLPFELRVQLVVTVPTVVAEDRKLTVPVGVFDEVVVSTTEAVQVGVPPIATEEGAQATVVEVLSLP